MRVHRGVRGLAMLPARAIQRVHGVVHPSSASIASTIDDPLPFARKADTPWLTRYCT